MKKSICFLLLMCILFGLTACAEKEQKKYDVYEIGEYDYISGANHNMYELDVPNEGNTFKEEIETPITFDFGGSTFSMRYVGTVINTGYHEEMVRYEGTIIDETGDIRQSLVLGINPHNNRNDLIIWINKDYLNTVTSSEKSRDECLEIAKTYLSEYVDSVAEYELYEEQLGSFPEHGGEYRFVFRRYIDNVPTSDVAIVRVTVYGDFAGHRFECLGEMQNAPLPSEDELAAMEASAVAKMDTIYDNLRDRYDIVYGEPELRFTRLYDGRYAMKYIYNVEYTSKETQRTGKERTDLLIFVE